MFHRQRTTAGEANGREAELTVSLAVPVGRWRVVSCPILDAAGLALQPRKGVSLRPYGLRFRAPVGVLFGRRH
jgi:hypothetical protein